MSKKLSMSDQFLQSLVGKKVLIKYLSDPPTDLIPALIGYDQYTLLLKYHGGTQSLIYKHAIESIELYI